MRWFVVIGTLALVAVAVMVLGLGFFPAPPTFSPGNGPAPAAVAPRLLAAANGAEPPPAPADVAPVGGGKAGLGLPFGDLLVIPNCHLSVIDKQDVPSKRDGTLLFIGAEVSPEELAKLRPDQIITV